MRLDMPLFRRNNKSLKFDIVGLEDDALEEITALVVKNGGKVVHDDRQPIKFTMPYQFVQSAFPGAKLYDVQFIKDCVERGEIFDPISFRIGKALLYDDCVMAHFLGATCGCCVSKIKSNEPMEHSTPNGSAVKRVAEDVNDDSRQVRHRSATQMNDNTENFNSMVTNPNRASNGTSELKIEWISPPKRKSTSSDNEKTSPTSLKNRVPEGQRQSIKRRKRGRGVAITRAEELAVLKYLTDNKIIPEAATGLQVWEEMIKSGICQHRSANSLYSHFKKTILPNIMKYNLSENHVKKFNEIKNM